MGTRENIREYLRTNLIGPRRGDDEVIEGRVHLNYMMGILFARGTDADELGLEEATPDGQEIDARDTGGEEQADVDFSGLADAFSLLPSSVGLSVCAASDTRIRILARAGQYTRSESGRNNRKWNRSQLDDSVEVELVAGQAAVHPIFGGKASVRIHSRNLSEGLCITTLTLVNEQEKGAKSDASKDLFQVDLQCVAIDGEFDPYPATTIIHGDDSEVDRALRISGLQPYAAGHGASATWESTGDKVGRVALEFLPAEYVGRPIFDNIKIGNREFEGIGAFNLAYLSDPNTESCE